MYKLNLIFHFQILKFEKSLPLLFLCCSFLSIAQISDFESVDFKKADSIALSLQGEDLDNLPELSHNLTTHLKTDIERFRAIYLWVCTNIKNDYGLYLRNSHNRQRFKEDSIKFKQWNDKFRGLLFKKLLKRKRTICTGYAYLVKALANLADLQCEIVQGYGRVSTTDVERLNLPNHSWNVIKLNKKWYLCDPTWASGIPNPETNVFTFNYNDGFFLANPKLFGINHFPIEEQWWLLEDETPTFKVFLEAPVIYGKAYEKLEVIKSSKQMHHTIKPKEGIQLSYVLKNTIEPDNIKLLIDSGSSSKKVSPTTINIKDKSLQLEHRFEKSGFYDIHLYLDEDLISTYTVEVKK